MASSLALLPASGWAQPFAASGRVGAGFGDAGATPSIALASGYQITRRARLEIEGAYAPSLDLGELAACAPGRICAAVVGGNLSVKARVVSLSGSLVSEIPIGAKWVRPYVVAGAGAAFVRFTERHTLFGFSQNVSSSGPMVTAGGGLEIPFGRRVALGLDVRHQWILAADRFDRPDFDAHFNVTVAGAALRVRF